MDHRFHSPNSATVSLSLLPFHQCPSTTTTSRHPLSDIAFFRFPVRVLENSTMFPGNNGGGANNGNPAKNADKGKRKMREFGGESSQPTPPAGHQINLFNVHGQHFASPSLPPPPDGRLSQVQQILNTAAPLKPFSYMSLLTALSDDEDDIDPLAKDIKDQREEIDQMILLHSENLKQALGGVLEQHHRNLHRGAEERAATKFRERESELQARNAELESMVEHYKTQAERMTIRVRTLERANRSLRERLQDANAFHREEAVQEEAESSFGDLDQVGPIRLDCKVCRRQLATVMLLPCRHVCVCMRCEAATSHCPVCRAVKTTGVEVHLPLN